jgi:hypothetical protein
MKINFITLLKISRINKLNVGEAPCHLLATHPRRQDQGREPVLKKQTEKMSSKKLVKRTVYRAAFAIFPGRRSRFIGVSDSDPV